MSDPDAVVVGSGPNGLAAALTLAAAGLQVTLYEAQETLGGGARTLPLTLPGYSHDLCSAVHPMAVVSPFFQAFDLEAHGVRLDSPPASYAHPLDGRRAAIAWRDLSRTVDELGRDGPAWGRLFAPLTRRVAPLVDIAMADFRTLPRSSGAALRLALRTVEQGSPLWNIRFRTDTAPALLTGVAAHAIAPPQALAPAGVALLLGTLAHTVGWPLPQGGSQAITDAMVTALQHRGGSVVRGRRIDSLDELPRARAILLDVSPTGLLRLAGDRLPHRFRRQLAAYRYGGAACKVDFALAGPVPWATPECAQAGTLHLVGSRAEAVAAETAVAAGRHADRPYVLAVQPGVVDSSRAPAGRQVLWTYAHVPNGSPHNVSEQIKRQVERFAPGFRDLILAEHVIPAARAHLHNLNYVGGDISGGATSAWQMIMRPVPRWDPYRTPVPGIYLCSASTPPGQAVHGMSGLHAASRALRDRYGIRTNPLDLVAQAYQRQPDRLP